MNAEPKLRTEFDAATKGNLLSYEEWLVAQLIVARDRITELEEEEHHSHRLSSRQGKLLTGVVQAIRGAPPPYLLYSHHDAPDLAQRMMRALRMLRDASRAVLSEYDETLRLAIRQADADETAPPNRAIATLREVLDGIDQATMLLETTCDTCRGDGKRQLDGKEVDCHECQGRGLITQLAKPLTDPGVPIPDWQDVFRKVEGGAALDPIEAFVVRMTPGDNERAADFRRMLRAALDHTAQAVRS